MKAASDTRSYTLHISGTLDADFLASFCPSGTTMNIDNDYVILGNLHTDQSGVIGIIRQLHNFGCIVLALETS